MKKGLGILFMLTLVVVVSSLAVFFVEGETTWRIEERQRTEVQEAVSEVFPDIVGTTWTVEESKMDFDTPITGAQEIKDGDTLVGIVYTVSFQGFANTFNYVVGVNRSGEVTGYKTLKNNETAGSAGEFDDPATFEFLNGALLSAASSAFDGVSGATYTSNFWKTSMDQVAEWHASEGVFPEIPQLDVDAALIKAKLADDTLVVTEAVVPTELNSTTIDFVYEATGDSGSYVIYIEEYQSYEPGTKVFLAVNATTHETVVFEVLENNDTPDWGGKLLTETDRWSQLEDESLNYLINGDFDDLGGATTTYSTWQNAMYSIAAYHQEVYQGIITYPMEVLVPEYNQQLSSVLVGGMATWTVAADEGIDLSTGNEGLGFVVEYDDPGANSQSITISQDGFDFTSETDYRITVVAYAEHEKGIKVTVGDQVSQKLTLDSETEDYADNTYRINYTPDADQTDLTLTLGLGKAVSGEGSGVVTIVEVRVEEMGDYVPDQATNQVVNSSLMTTAVYDVTDQKYANVNISNVFDVVNDLGEVEGTIYYGYAFGAYDNGITLMNFMLGIDADGNYTGFRFLSTDDSAVNPSEIYTADYTKFSTPGYFADEIVGLPANADVTLEVVEGLELQIRNIEMAINEIGRYHTEDYSKRFNESIDTAALQGAFEDADSFVEIYNDYDFVSGVVNVYEAYDENVLVGYVYAGRYYGMSSSTPVSYTLGVALNGVTEQINIYDDAESWEVSGYGGSEGDSFPTSTWLSNFEALNVENYVAGYTPNVDSTKGGVSADIDSVSGVSTTTGGGAEEHFGLIDSVYTVLKFHEDNNVGGAS